MNIDEFKHYLISDEKSDATVAKYIRDVTAYIKWIDGREISKELTMEYKKALEGKYEAVSVNTMLSSLNSYFDWLGHPEYKVKNIKIQKDAFADPKRELTKEEYEKLLQTAYEGGKFRLYYVMQTLCSCGIRVSELKFITVEAIKRGIAYVANKGKSRKVYIPYSLAELLKIYIEPFFIFFIAIYVFSSSAKESGIYTLRLLPLFATYAMPRFIASTVTNFSSDTLIPHEHKVCMT